jgi:hypothetical protein
VENRNIEFGFKAIDEVVYFGCTAVLVIWNFSIQNIILPVCEKLGLLEFDNSAGIANIDHDCVCSLRT